LLCSYIFRFLDIDACAFKKLSYLVLCLCVPITLLCSYIFRFLDIDPCAFKIYDLKLC